ncbi:MAG: hypothetical protein J0L88_12200 [Xanthomonadales bacterium]|nr:hypothetical protein [Xanthomonadales bacterium]
MLTNKFLTVIAVAGLVAACQYAEAATSVVVGDAPPMPAESAGVGYTYEGGVLTLNAPLGGPVFCGNPLLSGENPSYSQVRFAPSHGNWILPTALDIATVSYGNSGEILSINAPPASTSLLCYGASSAGWPLTPFRGGLFYHGFEDGLPANPYAADVGMASVTGIDESLADGPRMLTQIDPNGNVYMYMFRLRAGAVGGSDVRVLVRDGYDASVLGDAVWHCEVTTLPSGTIDLRALCANNPSTISEVGPLKRQYLINGFSTDRYIIVHRFLTGSTGRRPVVAGAAVFVRPGPAMDRYIGDNVVFSVPPLSAQ